MEEFDKLHRYEEKSDEFFTSFDGERYNKDHESFLSFDHNRVKLRNGTDGLDYVNASWLSPISEQGKHDDFNNPANDLMQDINFIIGQDPMPQTMSHHFQMIHENGIHIVVNLQKGNDYKPLKFGAAERYGQMEVNLLQRKLIHDYLFRSEISLCNTTQPDAQYQHNFISYQFTAWPQHEISLLDETHDLVSAICVIRQQMKHTKGNIKVMSHDPEGGVCSSAVFVCLLDLLQKVDAGLIPDDHVKHSVEGNDVSKVVNNLRKERAKMINTYSTFKLVCFCLEYYRKNKEFFHRLKPKGLNLNPCTLMYTNARNN
jgi:protein tyrosine phosphatase